MDGVAQAWVTRVLSAARASCGVSRVLGLLRTRLSAFRIALAIVLVSPARQAAGDQPSDRLKELQASYVANASQKLIRAYHFGSQGPGDVFSNHTSHTNRLVPVYVFGKKAHLEAVTGANSRYRDPEKLKAVYGFLPKNTVNPSAVYADQSDLYSVQKEAIARGVKHLFIVWFDGLDWPTTQAAAIVKSGKIYAEGKGMASSSRIMTRMGQHNTALLSPVRLMTKIVWTSTNRRLLSRQRAWRVATMPGSLAPIHGCSAH